MKNGFGQLGVDWGSLLSTAAGYAKDYLPAVQGSTQQACGIVQNPAAGAIAQNLLSSFVGSSAGSYISQAASAAASACGAINPPKSSVTAPTTTTVPKAGTVATSVAPPTGVAKPKYPAGTLYYFDPKTRVFMVSLPIGAGLGCVGGDCIMGLGQSYAMYPQLGEAVTNLPPQPTTAEPAAPAVATTKAVVEKASGTTPFYKKWWFWTAVGGGTLALGTGTYLVVRKPQHG